MSLASRVRSGASAISSTDDPIALVNWVSAFLTTLEKFDAIGDEIAKASITLCPVSLSTLTRCLGSSLHASSMDYPLFCFQGLSVALRWSHNLIYGLQMVIGQAHLDDSVCNLLSKMDEVYIFLTDKGLKAIKSMKGIVDRVTHQTLECSRFIQAYCGDQKFRKLSWPRR